MHNVRSRGEKLLGHATYARVVVSREIRWEMGSLRGFVPLATEML